MLNKIIVKLFAYNINKGKVQTVSLLFSLIFSPPFSLNASQQIDLTNLINTTPDPFAQNILANPINFKLTGIVHTEHSKAALIRINNQTQHIIEQEIIHEWMVEKIEKDFILISKGDERKTLLLVPPF